MRQILLSDYYKDFYDEEEMHEKKTRLNAFLITLAITGALLCPVLLYLNQQVQYARLNYRLNSLKETQEKLENENKYLQARKNYLSSLERIESIARKQLGMVPAEKVILLPE